MKVLTGAMRDENEEIKESAVLALADLGTEGAIKVLMQGLYEADEHLMLTIAEKLSVIPEGQDALREATQAEDLMVRRAAAHGLEFVRQPWADEVLERLARDDPQWLVRAAADAILKEQAQQGQAPPPTPTSPPQIDELDWLIAWAAQQGSGLGVGAAAMEMLVRATTEGKTGIQILGAMTLRQIGHKRHLEALRGLLQHKDDRVRRIAADAVYRIEERYYDPQETGITS
jgi:HEAT repeat protein